MELDRVAQALKKTTGYLNGVEEAHAAENARMLPLEKEPDASALPAIPLDVFGDVGLIGQPPCPLGLLPPVLETYALDVAERLNIDPAMVFMPMLAVCAAAIDDRVQIIPQEHDRTWKESPRLWVAFVADSGEKKTPAMKAAMAPLYAIEKEWTEEDEQRLSAYQQELAIFEDAQKQQQKAKAKALAAGHTVTLAEMPNPPQKPIRRRKIVSNVTIEALGEIAAENPAGLIELHDELSGWFGSFDAYRAKSTGKDRALYLEAYNGGPQIIDRMARGRTYVPNWSICLIGGIQPEPMRRLAGQVTDDGLIQRFMVVFVRKGGRSLDRAPNEDAKVAYEHMVRRLVSWDIGGPEAHVICQLDPEAQPLRHLINTRVDQVRKMPWVGPPFQAHLAKWEGLFPRLTLLWHILEHADDLYHLPRTIGVDTAERVATFMLEYLLPHAAQFYAQFLTVSADESHAQWIAGHILTHEPKEITTRDIGRVYRPLRGNIRDTQQAMLHLTDLAWVQPANETRPGGARRWKVNPLVYKLFSQRAQLERQRRAEVIAQIQTALREFPKLQPEKTSHVSLEENTYAENGED